MNAPEPPVGATEAVPLQAPLQAILVCVAFGVMGGGAVSVNWNVVSQPSASVMVTAQSPAQSWLAAGVPCPTVGTGAHTYVYGIGGPLGASVMLPSHEFAQRGSTTVLFGTNGGGAVMVKNIVVSQPEGISVMTT